MFRASHDSSSHPPGEPASAISDERLAAQAAGGDGRAFEGLVTRYQHRVFRLVARLTSDTEAPDVLQETFLQVHRHLTTFRGESSFSTWLYRIATNAALMCRRARMRRPSESLDAFLPRFDANGRHAELPEALRIASRVEELIDRRDLAVRARLAVAELPDLYRDAFVLRDLEDMPTAEVAAILDIDAAAVRQRVHRARLMLRGKLQDLAAGGTS